MAVLVKMKKMKHVQQLTAGVISLAVCSSNGALRAVAMMKQAPADRNTNINTIIQTMVIHLHLLQRFIIFILYKAKGNIVAALPTGSVINMLFYPSNASSHIVTVPYNNRH